MRLFARPGASVDGKPYYTFTPLHKRFLTTTMIVHLGEMGNLPWTNDGYDKVAITFY
jgi:hypothetical protein